jgi:hypothetical protein
MKKRHTRTTADLWINEIGDFFFSGLFFIAAPLLIFPRNHFAGIPPQDPEAGKKAEYVDHFFQIDSKLNNNKPFNKTITHQHKKTAFRPGVH